MASDHDEIPQILNKRCGDLHRNKCGDQVGIFMSRSTAQPGGGTVMGLWENGGVVEEWVLNLIGMYL